MISKYDIEKLRNKLELELSKIIILRDNYKKSKGTNGNLVGEYIIEGVHSNVLVLRRVMNDNTRVIETYKFTDILSGAVEILDIK